MLRPYRFHLVCPNCKKTSTMVQTQEDSSPELPTVSCGDCLMHHTEVVRLKVVKVVEE